MDTIKQGQTKIITLKGIRYIPCLAHQLPKKYEEIPLSEQFNLNGYTYISEFEMFSSDKAARNFMSRMTFNKGIGGIKTR